MELKRQHIFDDILGGGSSTYHSAVLTSFSFDPFFYANFFKPQLAARGISNQLVLVDASRLDDSKEDERFSYIPGVSPFEGYTPLRIQCPTGGVFHPKIGFFVGEKRITAVIGSGNLTYSGMSFNDEAWCAFSVASLDSPDCPVVASIWKYILRLVSRQELSVAKLQVSWMLENSELLHSMQSVSLPQTTEPDEYGNAFEFIANTPEESILGRIHKSIAGKAVKRITVCTPFFDVRGAALCSLYNAFHPQSIDCLVNPEEGSLPEDLNRKKFPGIRFFEFSLSGDKRKRMVHAKLIQLETEDGTILAIGSANASIQALGMPGSYNNDEAEVIIHHYGKHDFLTTLGIKKETEIQDLHSFPSGPGDGDDEKKTRRIILGSCERLEDGFHLNVWKGKEDDVDIHFVDDFRKAFIIHQKQLCEGMSILPAPDARNPRTVFVTKDRERISNKCIILILAEVEKKNPDQMMAPIARLLETAKESPDFEKLLQYVHIEEETHPHSSVRLSSGREKAKQAEKEHQITDDDLENTVFRNRRSTLEQINDQILEKLARLFISSSNDQDYRELPQDESILQDDIDRGLPEDDHNDSKGNASIREFTVMDEARGYFRRLLKYYDSLSWNCPEYEQEKDLFFIKKPFYLKGKSDLSYSAVCIAVYEMCKIAKMGSQDDWQDMIDYFVPMVGSFLLIHRLALTDCSPATAAKIKRKHRNLVVYCLLLLSFWEDYGIKNTLMRLLALNLMDSYKDDLRELEAVYNEYEGLLDEGILPTEEGSLQMICRCYAEYLAFQKNKNSYRGVLSPSLKNAIIYRPSFGFVLVKNIRYSKQVISKMTLVSVSAIAPGFPEKVTANRRELSSSGFISETTLNESVLIFEKE